MTESILGVEGQHLEFKRELTDSLEKEVIAFLNTRDGGVILIGVDDDGTVVGIDDTDTIQLNIKDRIRKKITPSTMGLFDVVVEQKDDKRYIKLIIASGSEKPYYLTKKGMSSQGGFIRIGSASEPMDQHQIDEMFAKRVRNSIGNISARYQDLSFEQLKIYYQTSPYQLNEQFAKNLELLTKEGDYNYAAYLLSDRNGCSIKLGKYQGTDRVDLIENQEFGYCSLIKATKAILDRLDIENKTFTQITAKERQEQRMLDPVAVREAVINAIAHNDFTNEIPPKFELFSDRLEITSTGGIPSGLSQEEFFMGYSIPQNKELMRVFRDLEMVEQMGSGIGRILQRYPSSVYQFTANFIRVVLPFAKGFMETQHPTNLTTEQDTPQVTPQVTLQVTPQAKKVLLFCSEPKSRKEIQDHLGLKDINHFKKAILNPLLEKGLLQRTIPDKPSSPKQQFVTAVKFEGEV